MTSDKATLEALKGLIEASGWHEAEGNPPNSAGDCRKLVWLQEIESAGGLCWIGIRHYRHDKGYWTTNGNREESAIVTHWMDLPTPPGGIPTLASLLLELLQGLGEMHFNRLGNDRHPYAECKMCGEPWPCPTEKLRRSILERLPVEG